MCLRAESWPGCRQGSANLRGPWPATLMPVCNCRQLPGWGCMDIARLLGSSLRAKAAKLIGGGLCTSPQVGAHRERLLLASHLAIGVEQDGAAALVFMQEAAVLEVRHQGLLALQHAHSTGSQHLSWSLHPSVASHSFGARQASS